MRDLELLGSESARVVSLVGGNFEATETKGKKSQADPVSSVVIGHVHIVVAGGLVSLVKLEVVLEGEGIDETLGTFPDGLNEGGLVITGLLIEVNLLEGLGLGGAVTLDTETDVLTILESLTLLGVLDAQTEAAAVVVGVVDVGVVERLGVVVDAVGVLVDTSRDLEGVRGLQTVGAVHTVDLVGDPDTI